MEGGLRDRQVERPQVKPHRIIPETGRAKVGLKANSQAQGCLGKNNLRFHLALSDKVSWILFAAGWIACLQALMNTLPLQEGPLVTVAIWNRRFETGIDAIDSQHKSLFEAVNRLAASFRSGNTEAEVKESLDFLARYTLEHFQAEEHFMHAVGYDGLAAHRVEHGRLMNRVRVLQDRLSQGTPVTRDVATFFAGWLKHHICGTDMAYVRFLKERAQSAG
jgi:hemerythrin-like metal-binding protein